MNDPWDEDTPAHADVGRCVLCGTNPCAWTPYVCRDCTEPEDLCTCKEPR